MQISKVIKKHGMTLQEVADKMEARNEKGRKEGRSLKVGSLKVIIAKDANPTIKTLRKIAEVIGCNLSEFFADEESSTSTEQTAQAELKCPHCGKPLNIHIS